MQAASDYRGTNGAQRGNSGRLGRTDAGRGCSFDLDRREVRPVQHDSILVGDLILLEVLQGAKNEAHAGRIEAALRRFEIANLIDEELAVLAAKNYRVLRGKGVTIRKTVDVIIGTFCIERGHLLLHDGRDFDYIATHLGRRVV